MRYLSVVLNVPIKSAFTYLDIAENASIQDVTGYRVDVKFGNRRMTGFVIAQYETLPPDCPVDESKIRPILRLLDKEPLFGQELIELSLWVSRFYLCSQGEALSAMLPGGKRGTDAGGFSLADEVPETKAHTLSEEQQKAVADILADSKNQLHYLYGATGTGKTEVFLQAAEKLLLQGKGVIYLVPEIGLTAQVIKAVTARFGKTVAVLHSELTPSQRLGEWKRILHREARVVIGARSAVFAPVPDLGMIIIDEEHDGSYKSGNTPRYHARQVAMYRAKKNAIPLVMGSATPSVESWHAMNEGIIRRHLLTRRLAGGKMPEISSIDLTREQGDGGCISKPLQEAIQQTLSEKRQTILFLNRRGFTHFFRCNSCGFELKCKNCSVSLTYHKSEKRLRCHYCGWQVTPPQQCPACGSLDVGYSGFGTEYIEAEVNAKFPAARIVRVDTDSLTHKGELQEKLDAFRAGEYDIMLGTQMVAKGLNFPRLQLVGVILADTGLHLPDFRASERTFALITQVAGRAGRFFPDGKVLVQTYSPQREPIVCAVQGSIEHFYSGELEMRKLLGFPPYTRMIRLVFRAPTEQQASLAAEGAAGLLRDILQKTSRIPVDVMGPAECPLVKIAMNWRYQILLRAKQLSPLQHAVSMFMDNYRSPSDVYIECDVDPVSLL